MFYIVTNTLIVKFSRMWCRRLSHLQSRLQDLLRGRVTCWALQQPNFKSLFPLAIHWHHTASKSLNCVWQQHEDHFGKMCRGRYFIFNCDRKPKFNIVTILSVHFSSAKYIYIVVQRQILFMWTESTFCGVAKTSNHLFPGLFYRLQERQN